MKSKKVLILINLVLLIFGGPIALLVGGIASVFLYKLSSPSAGGNYFSEHQGQYGHSTGHHDVFEDDLFESSGFSSHSSTAFSDGSTIDTSLDNGDIGSTFSGITHINPATGLPMVGDGIGGFDVGGSPYGFDAHDTLHSDIHDPFHSSFGDTMGTGFDDSFSSSFDDSFSSGGINNDW